ncbi:transposase [Hydrogenophaga taeniospiralis]|uniref:transposase n=1 Tax=Hydrogenophaga taeniospiralis TaxID=65656 RepID=UPI001CFA7572|nr:transposase [Hydrogenophaga taeniospiralis]UCU93988.1 transposase family protein [Hydrogenophaga taeniospiralis]
MATAQLPFAPQVLPGLLELSARLKTAGHGERRAMVEAHACLLGRSTNTVYAWLRDYAEHDSGRKRRADAGTSRLPMQTLDMVAALLKEGQRQNGKQTMPLGVAMNILDANGYQFDVSPSQVGRLLRQHGLDMATLETVRVTQDLRALHPNHVHEIDPSLCLLFYAPGGKQHLMTESKFYKNKSENFAKVKLKVWRYVRYDRASGVIDVRYYESAGENQAVLFDFLMWTWGKQEGRLNYGVPKLLLWDKGSANTSHAIQNLLDSLGVKHETHAAGHAWAKGGVEQANNLVETQFESRLRVEPVNSVDELNAAALRWARDWNANLIKHVDARLVRASGEPLVRDDLWSLILREPGALVALPSREVCQWFMAGREKERQVNNLQITFAHPELGRAARYDLRAWAEFIHNRQKVVVTPLLLRDGLLRVEIARMGAEPLLVEVEPVREFDAFGSRADAQVIGEGYVRSVESASETAARRLVIAAYGDGTTLDGAEALREKSARPFSQENDGKGLTAHGNLGHEELPQRLLPAATETATDAVRAAGRAVREVQLEPLNHVQAATRLRALVGSSWTAEHFAWLAQRYPGGVQEDALDSIAAEINSGRPMQALRAVGGA